MKNKNALITMAHVSQNAGNPYSVFCEYIKYCVFSAPNKIMLVKELLDSIKINFGTYMPKNVLLRCLDIIKSEGKIKESKGQICGIGEFDLENFEKTRSEYRSKEDKLLSSLITYVSNYNKSWDLDYAREQLVSVLDTEGIAYDVVMEKSEEQLDEFIHKSSLITETIAEDDNFDSQPLYSDAFFVGRFIKETLSSDSIYKEYLQKVCEGLMICIGTYQLADENAPTQIRGTTFYFDTTLLLRFLGCASEMAVSATQELIKMIQELGGVICYYPHTSQEIENAFEEAIDCMSKGVPSRHRDMQLYVTNNGINLETLTAKKASFKNELENSEIYLRNLGYYTEKQRIDYGFDYDDLERYMLSNLNWESQTIKNDALSIWETHMSRQGDYSAYCGTNKQLSVFVTSNTLLASIALDYKRNRLGIGNISGWKTSRLPVITDVRLTCRLWEPQTQASRLSLLYLASNAVAAQRPTQKYFNTLKKCAEEIKTKVPAYANICLNDYFDERITEILLEKTKGDESKMDASLLASSIKELTSMEAEGYKSKINTLNENLDAAQNALGSQTNDIVEGAVEDLKNKIGLENKALLRLVLWAPWELTVAISIIATTISFLSSNWNILLLIVIFVILTLIDKFLISNWLVKRILKCAFPKIKDSIVNKIKAKLRKADKPYENKIIDGVLEKNKLTKQCIELIENTNK